MNNTVMNYINLGGVGFTEHSESLYEKHKTYNLKLSLPEKELELKIAIIEIDKKDDGYAYRAVYRNLSDSQLSTLKDFAKLQPSKLKALSVIIENQHSI